MKHIDAIQLLREWDQRGRYVFTRQDLKKILPTNNPTTFTKRLNRLTETGTLKRVCRGVYLNPHATHLDSYTIERIAIALRRGHYNYVSLESMLSEYGVISQIPIDRLTVMTTGRKGVYTTPYGTIEFTHTKRNREDILNNTQLAEARPLRIATKETAWRDLKRVGRNTHLLNKEELK